MAAASTGAHGSWRLVLTVAFASFVPGAAVVAHRPPEQAATAVAVIVALSWTVMVLVNDGLVQIGWWHPLAVLFGVGSASSASLLVKMRTP
jgi:hypothetical protein